MLISERLAGYRQKIAASLRREDLIGNDLPSLEVLDIPWQEDLTEQQILDTKIAYNDCAHFYADAIEWTDRWDSTALHPANAFLGLLEDQIRKLGDESKQAVLDFGCGSGKFIGIMAKRFNNIQLFGIDDSAGMLAEAKKRLVEVNGRLHLHNLDISQTQAGDHIRAILEPETKVSGIYCNSAFTHIPKSSAQIFFHTVGSLMEAGGIMYTGVKVSPNGNLWMDTDIGKTRWFTTYSLQEMNKLRQIAQKENLILISEPNYTVPHHNPKKPDWGVQYWLKV